MHGLDVIGLLGAISSLLTTVVASVIALRQRSIKNDLADNMRVTVETRVLMNGRTDAMLALLDKQRRLLQANGISLPIDESITEVT